MRARVHDAEGPGRWRFFRVAFGPVFFLFLLGVALESGVGDGTVRVVAGVYRLVPDHELSPYDLVELGVFALSGIFALLWPVLIVRRRSRVLSVRTQMGLVKLGWGFLPWNRIQSTEIEAVRTARAAEGASLVLVRRHGSPVFLELDEEETARSIETSLLESGAGMYDLSFEAQHPGAAIRDRAELLVRAAGVACWILFFLSTSGLATVSFDISTTYYYLIWDGIDGAYSVVGVFCVIVGFFFHLLRHFHRPRLVLDDREISVGTDLRVKYADIASVNVTPCGIGLLLERPLNADPPLLKIGLPGLSQAELEHVAAHVVSAVQHAKGTYADRHSAPVWLENLSRGKDEPVRAWLSRLDGVNCARNGDPYRNRPFDREEIVKTIHDGEAPIALRVAAARVLRRIDPADARKRVGEIDARIDPDAARRLRVAIETDIDEASGAYESLPPLFRVLERRAETTSR